jgi:hypothetical protein
MLVISTTFEPIRTVSPTRAPISIDASGYT